MTPSSDPIVVIIEGLIKLIINTAKALWWGVRKLDKKGTLIGLLISIVTFGIGYYLKHYIFGLEVPIYVQYSLYYILLAMPIIYIMCLGAARNNENDTFNKLFAEIGFIGKDKKYPYFISKKQDGKKNIYTFKSNIPIDDWKKSKGYLETALDCNILLIQQGSNKKIAKLTTVPSDCQIPKMVYWNDSYLNEEDDVITIGQGALENISFDLNDTPHVLAAGETGSGKSVVLRNMLWQMINKGCRLFMIDFKGGVEFGLEYEDFGEVITDRNRALEVLSELVEENERRLALFRKLRIKNLKKYNEKQSDQKPVANLCRIGVFIDEIAEMLDKKGASKEDKAIMEQLEGKLSTLARLGRAAGINLFLGVQRPDANVLTGQIKNNVPVRVCGRFADNSASEIVLGNTDATDLPTTKGRFLYKVGNETIEFQAFYFDDATMLHEVSVHQGDMLMDVKVKEDKPTSKGQNQKTNKPTPKIDAIMDKPKDSPSDNNFFGLDDDIDNWG